MLIKESELRSFIRECIVKQLNEGYSSKSHQEEIIQIAQEMYRELFENGNSSYHTNYKIPIGNNSWNSYSINGQFGKKEDAVTNRQGITVIVTKESTLNTIAKLLMHEFTHIFDRITDKQIGFDDSDLYYGVRDLSDVPDGFGEIIYHLWIPTEFNAFQTTYDFKDENFNAMFERFMGYIQEAYNFPTTKSIYWKENYAKKWEGVRNALKNHIPNRYQKCDIDTFKTYFIKHSLYLLNKLVKKWNGKQNVNFV